MAKFEGFV